MPTPWRRFKRYLFGPTKKELALIKLRLDKERNHAADSLTESIEFRERAEELKAEASLIAQESRRTLTNVDRLRSRDNVVAAILGRKPKK